MSRSVTVRSKRSRARRAGSSCRPKNSSTARKPSPISDARNQLLATIKGDSLRGRNPGTRRHFVLPGQYEYRRAVEGDRPSAFLDPLQQEIVGLDAGGKA